MRSKKGKVRDDENEIYEEERRHRGAERGGGRVWVKEGEDEKDRC